MTNLSDMARRQALCELLSRRDPFDSLRRHRVVIEGDPQRFEFVPRLAAIYIQSKLLEMRPSDGSARWSA